MLPRRLVTHQLVDQRGAAFHALCKQAGFDAMMFHDDDAVPEVPEDPVSKPGDVWVLGDHRVLCGDATKAKRELGWHPRYSGIEALRTTLHPEDPRPNA